MIIRVLASRFLSGQPARALSLSCRNESPEKSKFIAKDEEWKWKSNYFKNHWNRETFGPKIRK